MRALATTCAHLGSEALAAPTDVTVEEQVRELARSAVARFGRIDVWVNNAGVIAFTPFEETPDEVFRRVIDVNLHGSVHGARAALVQFGQQGSGTLINAGSLFSEMGGAGQSAYVDSKYAVHASLRRSGRSCRAPAHTPAQPTDGYSVAWGRRA